eukprot:TRINITY_DN13816_c0_g1_i1.p1 TRINITY_DN13816_c0_g1~~TRINITY_DN13816_c0_g1_i1.p1  ORF type:complete len:284 (+),score=39.29 TRINITY_DN13816_c0_g1_i1:42-893(+)
MDYAKNGVAVGTWDDLAFQLAIDESGRIKPEPIPIEMVDMYGFHCIPHVGVYGDDYTPCIPVALLQLPPLPLLSSNTLFKDISTQLTTLDIWDAASSSFKNGYKAEFYVLVHPKPILSPCQKFLCENMDEVNMMYHPWLFGSMPLTEDLSVTKQLYMGLFDTKNIKPVHQNLKDAGISFGSIENRSVALHGLRFSPENAQFQLDPSQGEIATFFAIAIDKETCRCVLSYHALPMTDAAEVKLINAVHASTTTFQLVFNLSQVSDTIGSTIQTLLGALPTAPQN